MASVFNSSRLAGKTVLITGSSGELAAPLRRRPLAYPACASTLSCTPSDCYALFSYAYCSLKGGIGAETALLFARAGANLILTARRQAQLDEIATKARESGVNVTTHIVDMRDRSAIKAFAESA